ncbi:MAG TPA: radical SAM protein [Anaeromyxobacteraceae bacterium]|nr:radical SAM protein [Anaeromyxobacteraceae bacterium]
MPLSRFVVAFREAAPGEHVLYDVLGDRFVGVDDGLLSSIERWKAEPPAAGAEAEAHAALAEMGFLVADEAADQARLSESWRRSAEGMPGAMYVTWLPTLACNLACSYCFQKDHPATGHMSAEAEAATLEYVLRRVDEAGTRKLVVHYIGGEPLTRKDLVLRSAEALSKAMAARGGSFGWELTTNGIGLAPEFVNALLALGEGSVKVTLDGDQETHDAARVYRSGQGTFEQVFSAMAAVAKNCPGVTLRVGGNFVAGQEASYERLLQRMEDAGLRGLLGRVRFKPVVDTDSAQGACAGCASATQEAETLVEIGRSVQRRGLARTPLSFVDSVSLCELHWDNAFVVDPAGRLYKCLEVAGRPEMAIGDVWTGIGRADPLTAARPWEKHAPCRTCAYLPVCGGGCLGGRYLQSGHAGEVFCRIESFEKSFREEIVSRYLAEFHADEEKAREAA